MTAMIDKLHVSGATLEPAVLAAGHDTPVRVTGHVYNVWGSALPRYQLSLRTDTDVIVTQDAAWRGLPRDDPFFIASGERQRLQEVEVWYLCGSCEVIFGSKRAIRRKVLN